MDKIQKACEGKTAKQGGMNVPELYKMASSQGYSGSKKRAEIIEFLCKQPDTSPIAESIGLFIEPVMNMHTDESLNYVFKSLTEDKAKLNSFFDKVPLTQSIKQVLKYSLEHDGHLKPSSLVNKVGHDYDDFIKMGLPSTAGIFMHDLVSVASLSDECEFGGAIEFKVKKQNTISLRLLLPNGAMYKDDITSQLKLRIDEVRSKTGCTAVMFGFSVPGHAMIMSIQDDRLYIFDTNSASHTTTLREYFSFTEKYGRVDSSIANFLENLVNDGFIKKIFINSWNPITDLEPGKALPFTIDNIPFDEICPNFQGRSTHFRQLMMSAVNKYGIDMFPGGFCLPWSFITIATYMTHGEMAPYILQDFLVNPDYYSGYHPDDIPGLQILFIHLISVYLTEIVSVL
jgi:hypothetical protein